MEKLHKHLGVERANGTLRAHPISRVHKDEMVQQYHNKVLKNNKVNTIKTNTKQNIDRTESIVLPIVDGYIILNLDETNKKGLKLILTRQLTSKTRRTIKLQIENRPARKLHAGEYFDNKRTICDIKQ